MSDINVRKKPLILFAINSCINCGYQTIPNSKLGSPAERTPSNGCIFNLSFPGRVPEFGIITGLPLNPGCKLTSIKKYGLFSKATVYGEAIVACLAIGNL